MLKFLEVDIKFSEEGDHVGGLSDLLTSQHWPKKTL